MEPTSCAGRLTAILGTVHGALASPTRVKDPIFAFFDAVLDLIQSPPRAFIVIIAGHYRGFKWQAASTMIAKPMAMPVAMPTGRAALRSRRPSVRRSRW